MPDDHYLYMALNLVLGTTVGAYGTLVGAGGGFVLVPLFLLVYHLPHELAVGTSLAIVSANAISGTLGYVREKKIDYRAGGIFALCTFPGAIMGASSVSVVSGSTFSRVFGILLTAVALYMLVRKPRRGRPAIHGKRGWGWVEREVHGERYEYFEPLGALFSVGIGTISSWFGIGGGVIHVPLMTEVLRFPVPVAVATSHFILGLTALVGTIIHLNQGHVNLPLALQAGAGAIVGAQLGVWLAKRVHGVAVLRVLAVAVLLVGLRLIFG